MAAVIREELGLPVELIRGSGGVFDVAVDGRVISSNRQTGQFPTHEEILEKLGKR